MTLTVRAEKKRWAWFSLESFGRIVGALGRLFRGDFVDLLIRSIRAAAPYIQPAYEVVRVIAAMTPTRADDEILRLIDHFGLPRFWQDGADAGQILREIALKVLQRIFPQAAERQLNRAIEVAYGAWRP